MARRSRRTARASHTSRYCRARCSWARHPRPETRWCSSQGTSTMRRPACSTSTVSPTSTPQPRASGLARSNAARLRQRMPDSGCVARQPVSRAMPSRASRTTKPCPPPAVRCGGRMAMLMSAVPDGDRRHQHRRGGRRWPRGRRRRRAGAAARSLAGSAWSCSPAIRAPVVIAAALPRLRAWRATTAPAARARSAVSSLLPSSTTTTRSTPGRPAAAATVAAMRSASSLAGMTATTDPAGTSMPVSAA